MGNQVDDERDVYKRIETASKNYLGRSAVRSLLDAFDINGPEGQHRCLVHSPLLESVRTFLHHNDARRLPALIVLKRFFLALDFLHNECYVAYTDIKAASIMFGTTDCSVFKDMEEEELSSPCARKELSGRTIYASRKFSRPEALGAPVLCDLGSAVPLDDRVKHREDIQPDVYRAPKIILDVPWTYSVDIWNAGCMVWDIFEGGHLFTGHDAEHAKYRSRAYLAEMIALLGPPLPSLLTRGYSTRKFFSDTGDLCAGIPLLKQTPLEDRETSLESDDRKRFLRLMHKMLRWDPEERSSARDLAEDEWTVTHTT